MIVVLTIALLIAAIGLGVKTRREGLRSALLDIVAALAAGCLAGIILGASARIAMGLLALAMGNPIRLTLPGTLFVVAVFSGLGMVLSLPYVGFVRILTGGRPLAYGIILVLVTFQPLVRTAADDLNSAVWDLRVIGSTVLVSVLMWVPYAVSLEGGFSRIYRLICSREVPPQSTAV